MSMNAPETPQKEQSFDLSRMTERDVAAEIERRIAAFKRAHNLAQENLTREWPPTDASPKPPLSEPAAPDSSGEGFAELDLEPSDPGLADVQPHPFLHARAISEAARRRQAGHRVLRAEAPPRIDAGASEHRALYSSDFSALLIGEEDGAPGERIRQLRIGNPIHAPARRRPYRAALLAGAAAAVVLTAAGAAIWQLRAGDPSSQPAILAALENALGRPAQISAPAPQPRMDEAPLELAPETAPEIVAAPVEPAERLAPVESAPVESVPIESAPIESPPIEPMAAPTIELEAMAAVAPPPESQPPEIQTAALPMDTVIPPRTGPDESVPRLKIDAGPGRDQLPAEAAMAAVAPPLESQPPEIQTAALPMDAVIPPRTGPDESVPRLKIDAGPGRDQLPAEAATPAAPHSGTSAVARIEAAHAPRLLKPIIPSGPLVEPSPVNKPGVNTPGVNTPEPPRLVAALKPVVPASTSAKTPSTPAPKPSVPSAAARTPEPFQPLLDFISPLTRQFSLAGQGGGGNGEGNERDNGKGNGGNK